MILLPVLLLILLLAAILWGGPLLAAWFSPPMVVAIQHVLVVAAVVAASLLVDGLIRFFYWHRYWKRRRGRETPALIRDILTIALLMLGLSLGLWWQEGLSFTGLVTASGATAIALGFALQTVIQDLFAGLSVNLEGSYAIGDWLTVYSEHLPEPVYGQVTGVTWRATFLTLVDGRSLMVPNHIVTANAVLNHSHPRGPKRFAVEVPVDIRVPRSRIVDLLLGEAMRVVRKPGMASQPAPDVLIDRLSGEATFFQVRFYADPALLTPDIARSIMFGALLDVVQHNQVASPVTQVEMTEPPALSHTFDAAAMRHGLTRADLFSHTLNSEQMDFVVARSHVATFNTGAVLLRQGEQASSMFVLLDGAVQVSIRGANNVDHEVAVLATGDIVGEMSLMTGSPRSATVTAMTGVHALEVTKEAISELLQQAPDLLQSFSEVLARRQAELAALAHKAANTVPTATDLLSRMRAFFAHALD